jgi:hypothetical protein
MLACELARRRLSCCVGWRQCSVVRQSPRVLACIAWRRPGTNRWPIESSLFSPLDPPEAPRLPRDQSGTSGSDMIPPLSIGNPAFRPRSSLRPYHANILDNSPAPSTPPCSIPIVCDLGRGDRLFLSSFLMSHSASLSGSMSILSN